MYELRRILYAPIVLYFANAVNLKLIIILSIIIILLPQSKPQ